MSGPDQERTGYDDVRRRLLDRGYLNGRIERFVLRDLGRPGPATLAVTRTTLKAALVGAAPLGAVIALGAVASHAAQARAADFPLLWLYGSLLALFGLGLLATLVAVPMTMLARRGARAWHATVAGLIAGAAVLVYLLLLWTGGDGPRDPGRTTIAVLSSLGAALLVVWLVRLVTVAGIAGHTGQVPRRRRWTLALAALTMAPVVVALLLARTPHTTEPTSFEPLADPGRTLVIAIDGAGGDLTIAGGESSLRWPIRDAARRSPPEVWTTLMTGVPPTVHGVHAVDADRLPGVEVPLSLDRGLLPLRAALRLLLPGRTVPVSGAFREPRTVWEIVALRRPVVAVNWWSSWPAWLDAGSETLRPGYVVSDRSLPKLLAGAASDRDTWPPSLHGRLAHEFEQDRQSIVAEAADRFTDPAPEQRSILADSLLIDSWSWRVTRRLWSDPALRVGFVYLPGLDIVRQRLDEQGPGGGADLGSARLIAEYATWLAGVVEEARARPDVERLVLISLPGRAASADASGALVISPAGGGPACVGPALRPLDLAPLLLRTLGFPASIEMPGEPDGACLDEGPARERVTSFGRRRLPAAGGPDRWDRNLLERLESLGYLN